MINLETQEVGTGKWFPITSYMPGTDEQMVEAKQAAEILHRMFGLYARVAMIPEGTR